MEMVDSIPLEMLVYGVTIFVVGCTILALKRCGYTFEGVVVEILENDADVTVTEDMDLSFIFPKLADYFQNRYKKEGKSIKGFSILIFILRSKAVESILTKYIRKKIIPRLLENKID